MSPCCQDYDRRIVQLETFVKKLLDPECFGLAVSKEVRDHARLLLGIKPAETVFIPPNVVKQ